MRSTWKRAVVLAAWAVAGTTAVQAQDVPGDQELVRRAIHVCAACHGEGGVSHTKGVPSLAGQQRLYTIAQLKDFRSQTRVEAGTQAYMWGVAALLDDATINGLADYFAAQPPAPGRVAPPSLVKAGRTLYNTGDASRGVRACADCHGAKGEGEAGFPRLAGQRTEYVFAQLKLFGTRLRPHGIVMKNEVRSLTPAEMRALASYVHTL